MKVSIGADLSPVSRLSAHFFLYLPLMDNTQLYLNELLENNLLGMWLRSKIRYTISENVFLQLRAGHHSQGYEVQCVLARSSSEWLKRRSWPLRTKASLSWSSQTFCRTFGHTGTVPGTIYTLDGISSHPSASAGGGERVEKLQWMVIGGKGNDQASLSALRSSWIL